MTRRAWRYAFHVFAAATVAYFTLPPLAAVLMSFTPSRFLRLPTAEFSIRWYEAFFADPKWMEGLWNTLIVGGLTASLALIVGLSAALGFARYRFKGHSALYTLALMPVFTPAVIIALALLATAHRTGLSGSHLIIAIAHSLWAFPIVLLVLRVALEGLDDSLEEAARGMGASPARVFFQILLPLIMPSIFIGVLFSLIVSVNEFVMALFLGVSETETLPRIIYPTLRYSLTPVVAAASGVLMLVTLALLLAAARLMSLRRLVEARHGG